MKSVPFREMAEFYSIPTIAPEESGKSLGELYELTDYRRFNDCFEENYKRFEDFLVSNGLVKEIGQNNFFFSDSNDDPDYVGWMQGLIAPYTETFNKHRFELSLYDKGLKASRGMRRIAHGLIRR